MLPALLVLTLAAPPGMPVDVRKGENKLTQLDLKQNPAGLTFDWSDAEETLRGTVTPTRLKAGQPLTISAVLESINGEEITSPLTFAVRRLDEMGSADTQTVPRGDSRVWSATFTPQEVGDYRIEISWRSTHHKVVRGVFSVAPSGLPEWITWVLGGGAIALAVGVGLWILFGKKDGDSGAATT